MDECLSDYNCIAKFDREQQRVYIIDDNPGVVLAAETAKPDTALLLFQYNHRTEKIDLESKKAILRSLADVLEGQKETYTAVCKGLYGNISFVLNNFNIRHNNFDPDNKTHYKKEIAEMKAEELEVWYDDLFHMIVLAMLEVEYEKRRTIVEDKKKAFKKG